MLKLRAAAISHICSLLNQQLYHLLRFACCDDGLNKGWFPFIRRHAMRKPMTALKAGMILSLKMVLSSVMIVTFLNDQSHLPDLHSLVIPTELPFISFFQFKPKKHLINSQKPPLPPDIFFSPYLMVQNISPPTTNPGKQQTARLPACDRLSSFAMKSLGSKGRCTRRSNKEALSQASKPPNLTLLKVEAVTGSVGSPFWGKFEGMKYYRIFHIKTTG